jgi:hypothetical protein
MLCAILCLKACSAYQLNFPEAASSLFQESLWKQSSGAPKDAIGEKHHR